jgi:hypothetical protein
MAMLVVLAIVTVGGVMIADFNEDYGTSYSIGLSTATTDELVNLTNTLESSIETGSTEDTSYWINFEYTWQILKVTVNLIWDFIGGNWIDTLFSYLMIPTSFAVAKLLKVGWFILVSLALVAAVLKVRSI